MQHYNLVQAGREAAGQLDHGAGRRSTADQLVANVKLGVVIGTVNRIVDKESSQTRGSEAAWLMKWSPM